MPDLITILVGGVGLVLGWALKTLADSWTWRRQQVLNAYLDLLDAVDLFGPQAGRAWSLGITGRAQDWADRAEEARQYLGAVDRAHGKLTLVAGPRAMAVGFELYIACERMFRRAVALPPSAADHYHEVSELMVKTYHDVVNEGRKELWLRHWQERIPGRESRWEMMSRRLGELNLTDPYPDATNPSKQPPSESSSHK
jgi:hypothetical protein